MSPRARLAAIVLCGGHSRRMGRPKAWLPFGNETLLQRVVGRVAPAVGEVLVVAALGQDLPPLPDDVRIVRDLVEDSGPLEGLRTGLRALDPQMDAAFVTGVDYPFVDARMIEFLYERLSDHDAVIPQIDGHWQPLVAVYRRRVISAAEMLLMSGERRLRELAGQVATRAVTGDELDQKDPQRHSLRNINNEDAYRDALALCEVTEPPA